MSKYFIVYLNTILEYFAYRLNFILWRLRNVISILITFFLWQSVFLKDKVVFGYSENRILTYIILLAFINGIVLSTQTHRIANEINQGDLSNFLLKPINFLGYNFFRDLSDKTINTFFSIIEVFLLIYFLKPPIVYQYNPYWLLLFIVFIILAALLYFEISIILSFIGFWSKETWAPRFIFFIMASFLAGTYFPLDIFPSYIYNFIKLLPFTYLVFYPLKIYLGEFDKTQITSGLIILISWIILLHFLLKLIWYKGLKVYTAEGR